jgi:uncharacterized protein YjbI with pentapeptide repeats
MKTLKTNAAKLSRTAIAGILAAIAAVAGIDNTVDYFVGPNSVVVKSDPGVKTEDADLPGKDGLGSKQDFSKQDFSKQDFSKQDFSKQDFSKQDFSKQDFSKQDFSKQDFAKKGLGSGSF